MIVCEVCVESLSGAVAVAASGADRIELCADLSVGGTTPSFGLIQSVVDQVSIPVMVMIRPYPGGFVFDDDAVRVMLRDIEIAKRANARGVVIGALTQDAHVDVKVCQRFVEAARPLQITFHRAFDLTNDPFQALEDLVELGVDRILTSGLQASVEQGIILVKELVMRAGNRIAIMPGAGVTEQNVTKILRETNAQHVHFSGGSLVAPPTEGLASAFGCRFRNQPERIHKIVQCVRNME